MRDHQTAIFCWSLGHLVSSGTRLDTALPLAADTMGEDAGAAFAPAFAKLRQGELLSEALVASGRVSPLALRMLRIGEQAGDIGGMALRAAELFDMQLEARIGRLVGLIGPIAIVSIALIVGFLVVTLMNALMSIGQLTL